MRYPESQPHSPSPSPTPIPNPSLPLPTPINPPLSLIQPSSFRNVSSCNRCRLRKSRCDQQLPRCQACEKAGTRCVGYDQITKREIPRSYVYFLEARVNYLMKVLVEHGIGFKPVSAFDEECLGGGLDVGSGGGGKAGIGTAQGQGEMDGDKLGGGAATHPDLYKEKPTVVSEVDPPRPRMKESASRTATTGHIEEENGPIFPDRDVALRLINCYFEYANPQMPVLQRDGFTDLFDRAYSGDRSPRILYFIHIVFAIGAGIIFDDRCPDSGDERMAKRRKVSSSQYRPKDYHTTAITYLQSSLGSRGDRLGRLEELQAIILLAHFALLQPVAPGPAHLAEITMRTAVNLGLYSEGADGLPTNKFTDSERDLRRRLWWCVYSLDRLVAPYIGRPFSISDQVVTTEFPSLLNDRHLTRSGGSDSALDSGNITHHYFKLRLLQSEIHDVLQYQRAQRARSGSKMNSITASSFLPSFDSFSSWRRDMNRRLDDWKNRIPSQKAGTCFPVVLLELDYWQTINLLYRQSIRVPEGLGKMNPTHNSRPTEDSGTEDFIYLKVAEASQKVLQLYRLMHHVRLVNYTYLATHSIFLAASSFLYVIWHSPLIRSQLTLNDIDYTLLAGTTILTDMVDRYPHADACRSSLERMGAATVQMCLSTAEFSSRADSSGGSLLRKDIADNTANDTKPMEETPTEQPQSTKVPTKRKAADDPIPQFDMNLEQLLSGQDTSLKPRDHPILDDSNDQIVKHLQPEQNPFLFPEYIEPSDSGEAQNLGIQDQNPLPDLTPMSIPSPCLDLDLDLDHDLDQLSDHGTQPSISLDFLDFDLPEPDIDLIPIIADGEGSCEGGNEGDGGEESTKLYDPFGDESGDDDNDDHQTNKLDPDPPQGSNLGFSISVDSQLELEENGYYDFMDAFLV